ncbi:MAG: hypothetical protein HF981_19480 [Desulfobacteraceae bacterium]|nr:hypothetical protein [Desulfobacteraceae bacterium]MBC2752583.1 hypothetical protein [Desulfobacteraceae bacterium]
MLAKLITIKVYLLIVLSIIPCNLFAMAGKDHAGDMVEVLVGERSARVPELRNMCLTVTKTIDNFKVIKGLPVGKSGHRVYGHWGFSGSIPFNKPTLRTLLDNVEQDALNSGKSMAEAKAARQAAKNKIINAWNKDVREILKLVEKETGLVGRQAKGLAGILYDIHLLGDWTGVKLEPLQAVDDLSKDIVKNIRRLLGNNSNIGREIEKEINKYIKFCLDDKKCKASAIKNILINSNSLRKAISLKLAEKYPLVSKVIASDTAWKVGLTLSAVSNRYNSMINKLPKNCRMPSQAGIISGLVSSGINGYQVIKGDIGPLKAAENIVADAVLSATSIYISDAILVKMGDKYALQTIASSKASNLCKAFGASVNLGLATFIFDETHVVYNFTRGSLTQKQFYNETGKAVLKTGGSFAATYCSVALGLSPSGPVVMFISIGGYILADIAITKYERWEAHKYVTIDDLLWQLPIALKHKQSILNFELVENKSIFSIDAYENDPILGTQNKDSQDLIRINEKNIGKKSIFAY